MKATFFATALAALTASVAALPAAAPEENSVNQAQWVNGQQICYWYGQPYYCNGQVYHPNQDGICYWYGQPYRCQETTFYDPRGYPDVYFNGDGVTFDYGPNYAPNGGGIGAQSRFRTPWGDVTTNNGKITCSAAKDGVNVNCVG